jgi:P-type Cu+ transporter
MDSLYRGGEDKIMGTKTLVKDPICGMSIDPNKAAGHSKRGDEIFYFCSLGCKEKFDRRVQQPEVVHTCCSGNSDKIVHNCCDGNSNKIVNLSRSTSNKATHIHQTDKTELGQHTHSTSTSERNIPDNVQHYTDNVPQANKISLSTNSVEEPQTKAYQTMMRKFWFASVISIPLMLLMTVELMPSLRESLMTWHRTIGIISSLISLPVLVWSGSQFFAGAWNNFRNHNANMDTLVALGTGAAWLYSTLVAFIPQMFPAGTSSMYFEVATIVIALILLGQALEIRAKSRSSAAIKRLLELQAKTARVIRDGKEIDIPVEEVVVDDTVLVRPGEKIPVDGTILNGESAIDESVVTGESVPVDKKAGDVVIGSSINKTGAFTFKATKVGSDTALARIVQMVEQAQNSKPPIGRLVDRISSYFVPSVMIIAILTFLAWFNFGPQPVLNFSIVTMVAVLVIACPCALGLATPISLMVGIGKAAEQGVLIRNGEALETASRLTTIVLDKTGTITKGKPELTDLISLKDLKDTELLRIAAIADRRSEHPLAEAIVNGARNRNIELGEPEEFNTIPGHGVEAVVEGQRILVGNRKLMRRGNVKLEEFEQIAPKLADNGKTAMFVAVDGEPSGVIGVADTIKDDSIAAINALKRINIEVVMITGDNEQTARAIARQVGIEHVLADVLPEEKAEQVKKLQSNEKQTKTRLVGMVGDGINDAPALAQADVGFAIGTGTDVAIDAADVTLVGGSLQGVVKAIEISRTTLRNIKQNLFGAFIYNTLGIPVAAGLFYPLFGILLSPIIAGAAMAASSITVVTNANRLRLFQPKEVEEVRQ